MKRILFYSENYCGANAKGGTEVATRRIAKALKDSGDFQLYNAFRSKQPKRCDDVYGGIIKLGKTDRLFRKQLAQFINDNKIDVVVNMSRFFRHKLIVEAAKDSGRDIKIFFMQHFAPGSEFKKATFKSGIHLLRLNPNNPLYWLRSTLYPLIKLPRNLKLKRIYREVYESSDKVILLSEGYKKDFSEIGGFSDLSKFEAIPNIFDSDPIRGETDGLKETKRVLIMSRLDEIQKRLSLALKIWQKIEQDPDLYEWQLDIVGDGHNSDIVRRLVKKLGLERVKLHGWQNREPFLRNAEILMMTSEYEGLPLSLLEAHAFGVVPVAFNSFASLKDVVEPFENGVVVEKFGDTDDYVKKLTELMYDGAYRNELKKNSLLSSQKFSSKNIAEQWHKILT